MTAAPAPRSAAAPIMAALSTHRAGGSRLQPRAPPRAGLGQRLSQRAVGRHAADDRELAPARGLESGDRALDELSHDRRLKARGEVGTRLGQGIARARGRAAAAPS